MPSVLHGGSHIFLDSFKKSNQFFTDIVKMNKKDYANFLKSPDVFFLKYDEKYASVQLTITATNIDELYVAIQDCISFRISENVIVVTSINRCDYIQKGYASIDSCSNTRILLDLLDRLALLFGCNRITLTDDARDVDFLGSKDSVYYSLITIMKEGKLFYEKYGYSETGIYTKIDLVPHINLLRFFPFKMFLEFLSPEDKEFALKYCKDIQFEYLHEYFTFVYEVCKDRFRKNYSNKYIRYMRGLQEDILLNQKYPWYSMMSIIFHQNLCMEKYI